MIEANFIKSFRQSLCYFFPDAFHWKTFNPTYCGESDLNIVYQGRYYKIEVKYEAHMPVKETSIVTSYGFSKPQYFFAKSISDAGGVACGLLGVEETAYIIPLQLMMNKITVKDLEGLIYYEYNRKQKLWILNSQTTFFEGASHGRNNRREDQPGTIHRTASV